MRNIIVDDWVDYLESIKDSSSNTIKNYERDVYEYLQFILYRLGLSDPEIDIYHIHKIPIESIDTNILNQIGVREIIAYISYTDKILNNSSPTRSRKLSSLRSFYSYIYRVISIIDNNPMELIEGPKIPRRLPEYMDLNQVKKLLETILEVKDDYFRIRDFAIVMLFLNTGLRLSELISLEINDLDSSGSISIIGKGNKERKIYLNASSQEAIKEYLLVRPDSDVDNVFLNKSGNNFLGARGIQYMLKKYIKQAGLEGTITPHTLRHTAATLLFKYGDIDIRTLQVILGHESISTTQIYTHVDNKQIETAINKNPIADLKLEDK